MPSAELAPIRSQGLDERPLNLPKDTTIPRDSNPWAAALRVMLDPANHIQALKNVENVRVTELSAMLDPANLIQALKNVENVQFSEPPVVSSDSVKRHRRPSGKAA